MIADSETTRRAAAHSRERHPRAGQTMMGAEMILQVLSDNGVDTIFGYSGGAILPTYDAIFRWNEEHKNDPKRQMRLIVPANEQGAGFMAAGYARATGKPGVLLVTSGPGATNCVTPVRDCAADSIPIIMLCGQVPRSAIGSDAFQEAPVFNLMSSCAKHAFLVKETHELEATIRSSFDIALSGRPGPVVIDLPKDIQTWTGQFDGACKMHFRGYERRLETLLESRVSKKRCAAFFDMLAQSERPLVYAGGGVVSGDADVELRAFCDRYKLPAVTTLMGIGGVDTTSELSLHMLGMHGTAYANYAVEDCDFLIAVGSRFDDRVAGKVKEFAPNARNIAHIDIDAAEIGKVKAITWSHVGDARQALKDLMEFGKDFSKDYSAWHKHVVSLKKNHALNYERNSPWIQPQACIEMLDDITKGQAIVSTGVGQHQMWAAQYFNFCHSRSWLTSGSMGTMGFGVPAAIGAKIACPDRIVICVDGDGSIRMNYGDLETATNYDVGIKVLLLNNSGDGMVRQWQKLMYENRFSGTDKTLHKKDFVKAAQADGYEFAERLSDPAKMREVLERFVAFTGPAFLEVMIDPDAMVFPMVGPGKGYKEMQLGPYITPRVAPAAAPKDEEKGYTLF